MNASKNLLVERVGLDEFAAKSLLLLYASYPFALLRRAIPSPLFKHVFDVAIGFFYGLFMSGQAGLFFSLGVAVLTYGMVLLFPRRPMITVTFNFLALCSCHMYQMMFHIDLSFDGVLMIQCLKCSSFAMVYYDGLRASKELSDEQMHWRISKMPNVLEFMGYVYFFPAFLAGPFFEIRTYLAYTHLVDLSGAQLSTGGWAYGCRKAITALACAAAVLASQSVPVSYAKSPAFFQHPFLFRVGWIWLSVQLSRLKYYFAWYTAEAAAVFAGFGYNGVDSTTGLVKWDGFRNADILGVELAENFREGIAKWNQSVAAWLQRYVYRRLSRPDAKPTSWNTLATYLVSAVWHGFYPGYYVFFLHGAAFTNIARAVRRKIRPHFVEYNEFGHEVGVRPLKPLYDVLGMTATSLGLQYIGLAFVMLDWEPSLRCWRSLYFVGHLGALLLYLLTFLPVWRCPPRKPSARKLE